MSTSFMLSLTAVSSSSCVPGELVLGGLPVSNLANWLSVGDAVMSGVGLLGLAFHCGAMFFTEFVKAIPGAPGLTEAINALDAASMGWYILPAVLVLAGLRRLHWSGVVAVSLALIAVGVARYNGGPLDVHLATIFAAVVVLALVAAGLVLPPRWVPRDRCPPRHDESEDRSRNRLSDCSRLYSKFPYPSRASHQASAWPTRLGEAMSRFYRFVYAVGFKPWEQDAENVAPQLRSLLAREEADREPPYGSALDLGCGTGRWSVELAHRGWDVTGIDLIPKAVLGARRRAEQAGVGARFVEGSVTALRAADVGTGFRLLLDVECFNHLNDEQRATVGREVDAIAGPDAAIVLLVWARARRGPFPPGATSGDVAAAFAGWQIADEEPYEGKLPRSLHGINPRWYRLVRSDGRTR